MAASKNLGRMEIHELVNHLAEAKSLLKNPGAAALTICECCIDVTIKRPGDDVTTQVDVIHPEDANKVIPLSIK
jgi:hypothetical protein